MQYYKNIYINNHSLTISYNDLYTYIRHNLHNLHNFKPKFGRTFIDGISKECKDIPVLPATFFFSSNGCSKFGMSLHKL